MSYLTNRTSASGEDNITDVARHGVGDEYKRSATRFWVYIGVRFLQVLVGIIGNILTLIIIYKLKTRLNVT